MTKQLMGCSGDYVLIHGSAGALGLAAIQISKALGLHVIATVNSAKKGEIAKAFGADHIVDSGRRKWRNSRRMDGVWMLCWIRWV